MRSSKTVGNVLRLIGEGKGACGNLLSSDYTQDTEHKDISDSIISALAFSGTYQFKNVVLTENTLELGYNSIIQDMECMITIVYENSYYYVTIGVDIDDLQELDRLPDSLYETFNNLEIVSESNFKIQLSDIGITLSAHDREYKDKYKDTNTIIEMLNNLVYTLDSILLELYLYDMDLVERYEGSHPSNVTHPFVQFKKRYKDSLDVYDMKYIKKPLLANTVSDIPCENIVNLECYSYTDDYFNITNNTVTALDITDKVEFNSNIFIVRDNEQVWLYLKEPKFVGVNGIYTDVEVDKIFLGEIRDDTYITSEKKDEQYDNMCIVHVLDTNYENRKFIMQL